MVAGLRPVQMQGADHALPGTVEIPPRHDRHRTEMVPHRQGLGGVHPPRVRRLHQVFQSTIITCIQAVSVPYSI